MIEFHHVQVKFRSAQEPSLHDLNLTISDGEVVLIKGPSGGGKSTFCLCLNGIIPHLTGAELTGDVRINGKNSRDYEVSTLSQMVGLVFQNPDNQLFAMTVEEDIAFGPENLGLPREEIGHRVETALSVTGMRECRSRQVFHLSGGQKQRAAISGIHAMNPDILVFDEPTADLDPRGTREVLTTIRDLNLNEGKTIILVEHKLEDVWAFCPPDRVITISEGTVTDDCPGDQYIEPERKFLQNTVLPITPGGQIYSDHEEIIRIQNLTYTYPDGTSALAGVSMKIQRGEFVSIIGENGCGKSTLLMHLNGLITPPDDSIMVRGTCISKKNARQISRTIGYLFQNPDNQICMDTVYREIAVGFTNHSIGHEDLIKTVTSALTTVDLDGYQNRDPNTLSRGERQRLAVASLIAMKPDILLLDEPTTGQDYDRLCSLMDRLSTLNSQGKTIIMVTHDLNLASAYSDRIIVMKKGQVLTEFSRPFPLYADMYSWFFEPDSGTVHQPCDLPVMVS